MNILTEIVVVDPRLDVREINRIVIKREQDGWKLKLKYKPINSAGMLELTFEKIIEDPIQDEEDFLDEEDLY